MTAMCEENVNDIVWKKLLAKINNAIYYIENDEAIVVMWKYSKMCNGNV